MILNVLKGAYPSLQQISKDHLMPASAHYDRGACLVEEVNADGETVWADPSAVTKANAKNKIAYFALYFDGDRQAVMAGEFDHGTRRPRVSALACTMPMEIETDMFDDTTSFEVGDYLAVGANGRLVKAENGDTAVLKVSSVRHSRWCNNAGAEDADWRQGNTVDVITGHTVFIPNVAIA